MSWLISILLVGAGLAVLFYLGVVGYQTAYGKDILADFRALNSSLLQAHFGPELPSEGGAWHRVLHVHEEKIIWPGEGILLGLRQIFLIEDQSGRHWRVVVAHEKGRDGTIHTQELGHPREGSLGSGENRYGRDAA